MKRSRFTEEQVVTILAEADRGEQTSGWMGTSETRTVLNRLVLRPHSTGHLSQRNNYRVRSAFGFLLRIAFPLTVSEDPVVRMRALGSSGQPAVPEDGMLTAQCRHRSRRPVTEVRSPSVHPDEPPQLLRQPGKIDLSAV
jgi:hypothetical protein